MGNHLEYQKVIIMDRDKKDNNKYQFGAFQILSLNCCVFPWSKGPIVSWISSVIHISFLVETLEHEESRIPNIEGFVSWSKWNKNSSCRGFGGITYYIKRNISPYIRIHKKDPLNQYIWM